MGNIDHRLNLMFMKVNPSAGFIIIDWIFHYNNTALGSNCTPNAKQTNNDNNK